MQKKRILTAIFVMALAALACGVPSGGGVPDSPDDLATIVASTLEALTPVASTEVPPAPDEPTGLLPHSLYYLANDGAGLTQVFRLDEDGRTIVHVTFEPSNVDMYAVSPLDGSVVYISNNQLLLISGDGTGRRLLVDGGPVDPIDPIFSNISGVAVSPDGETIAYGLRGINLYNLPTGASSNILPQRPSDIAFGQPAELYWPKHYSPDGSKLLITAAIPNSDGISTAVLFPATGSLIRLTGEGGFFCCEKQGWSTDGSSLYSANDSVGMFGPGFWRFDPVSGTGVTLISGDAGGGNFNLISSPYLAPDGQLYYFHAIAAAPDGFIDGGPLQIIRAAIDGVTGRMVVRPETFESLSEALWAPDASFVLVVLNSAAGFPSSGRVELIYLDGRPNLVLVPNARQLQWGP